MRKNLVRCGIGIDGAENNLLMSCLTWVVWSKVHRWFGLTTVLPDSIGSLFRCFLQSIRCQNHALKGVIMAWPAVIWVLRARNKRIFREIVIGPEEIFDRIQVVSWKWLMAKKVSSPCLFYEFCIESFDCIIR
jgi:hypothetical protein